ncbi:hypothetical protein FT663_00414 [Candidozyma haemuli var. vulneris]|uniref:FHA domain-containing protein n=1 Tax=Candidozyma haemuli TaxID=45357 RepID=A0A2V1AVU4_9ASCO|nr:hypothetical protein CXQ85_000619 [[Candida] haemuloni]KAF3988801.1 hypothetical protein FT662_03179 [[Candida] haemuloni var. vulneris]KAF3995523.1 hypothetical protein FT663_00414 [[Candida] haemuloni var. vulneris]PVH21636.1 hypothetical protein CXQ85_000619 [[Candida] haemuloni]
MDYQFPPSSPVTHDSESRADPFSKPKSLGYELPQRGRFDYPTPNPSSTVGRSSSPARNTDEKDLSFEIKPKTTVSINRDFNIINPDSQVLRVPLVPSKPIVFIGRSSKSCDFFFKTLDKAVSRTHIKIEHNKEKITLQCLGYNGFGMVLPRMCEVRKVDGKDHHYSLSEAKKPLKLQNLSKTIHLDYQHTEFHVSRGETVELPSFSNVLVQIRDKIVLVNPADFEEDLTDEETIELVKPVSSEKQSEEVVQSRPLKLNDDPSHNLSSSSAAADLFTPNHSTKFEPQTPQKFPFRITSEEPTPIKTTKQKTPQFTIHEDKLEESTALAEDPDQQSESRPERKEPGSAQEGFKRATTPLTEKTNHITRSPLIKRRAVSEEPVSIKKQRKEPARDSEGKLIIDGACIKGLKNVREINNILINHLAFSRLSSTPASFLNTISAVVSELSLEQLRTVLHNVECIGVIYRQGKDAAGKPLEEEYYYIPENDQDPERTKLVGSIKGHGGLRACRRKHKQYYWKKPAPIKK